MPTRGAHHGSSLGAGGRCRVLGQRRPTVRRATAARSISKTLGGIHELDRVLSEHERRGQAGGAAAAAVCVRRAGVHASLTMPRDRNKRAVDPAVNKNMLDALPR